MCVQIGHESDDWNVLEAGGARIGGEEVEHEDANIWVELERDGLQIAQRPTNRRWTSQPRHLSCLQIL